ncbi:Transmembrane protein 93 [Mycena indigotica]|uniref:ER membrane protein complex subunit 6 n=1 Tax=Mycena indigotica TaxID=2126181 RepID=A0A8H6T7R9_9AGAR|nr:Transmembrane protein 93 [Mycena indigotica]KAF7312349.1 Transmembrane protein 93 [Mycena indigotica]
MTVKFLSACFAGAVAGILGLQNWAGFALFLASTLFTSFCIYFINCHGKPKKYFPDGWTGLLSPGQENAFTFILVWTLFFGIVHVYD